MPLGNTSEFPLTPSQPLRVCTSALNCRYRLLVGRSNHGITNYIII